MWRVIRLVVWGCEGFTPMGLWALHYLCTPKIIGLVAPMGRAHAQYLYNILVLSELVLFLEVGLLSLFSYGFDATVCIIRVAFSLYLYINFYYKLCGSYKFFVNTQFNINCIIWDKLFNILPFPCVLEV
jgi:hypothetical protein